MPVQGVGSLIVADLLSDVSYTLVEPVVNTVVPVGGIAPGAQTVLAYDPSMYVGAQILVGVLGGDLEVVTLTAVVVGTSFSAVFANAHVAGEAIYGPTFPVQNAAGDPFWTQPQMLQYISDSLNDYVTRVPLAYVVTDSVVVGPTQPTAALPADCMMPVRVVPILESQYGNGLRETSQSWLDSIDYRWQQFAASEPAVFYRDKIGLNQIGLWPFANNSVPLELVYTQRSAQTLGLADGFIIPDVFLPYVKARTLEFCYSSDSEQRSPGMAKFWNSRFETGVKLGTMIMQVIEDTSMQ